MNTRGEAKSYMSYIRTKSGHKHYFIDDNGRGFYFYIFPPRFPPVLSSPADLSIHRHTDTFIFNTTSVTCTTGCVGGMMMGRKGIKITLSFIGWTVGG